MNQTLNNLFNRGSKFLGSRFPIMGGAMSWVSESNLVAAISNAGGFGIIACGSMTSDQLKNEINKTKKKTTKPFGVNLILVHPQIDELFNACFESEVEFIILAGGFPKKSQILRLKEKNIKTIAFASTLLVGEKLIKNGIDALIIEGNEAGGHIGPVSSLVLAQEILPNINKVPVFVAGGIGRGEIFLNYLNLGASGCQIGTRFVCATESIAHIKFKEAFIRSEARNSKVSIQLDDRLPVIPVRAIENEASKEFVETQKKNLLLLDKGEISLKEAQLNVEKFWAGSLKRAVIDGDIVKGSLMAGQSVSLVKKIQPVTEIINEIISQAELQIKNSKLNEVEKNEL